MVKPWKDIKTFYQGLVASGLPLQGMLQLVEQIEGSRYVDGVHGETSMHDLCLTQIASSAYPDGPHLRISPRFDGTIEFRYVDTYLRERQWHRIVKEDEAISRLIHFFDQLRWFGSQRAADDGETARRRNS